MEIIVSSQKSQLSVEENAWLPVWRQAITWSNDDLIRSYKKLVMSQHVNCLSVSPKYKGDPMLFITLRPYVPAPNTDTEVPKQFI